MKKENCHCDETDPFLCEWCQDHPPKNIPMWEWPIVKSQLRSILGWAIAVLAIAFVILLRILAFIVPIAAAVFVGIWIYHHV